MELAPDSSRLSGGDDDLTSPLDEVRGDQLELGVSARTA